MSLILVSMMDLMINEILVIWLVMKAPLSDIFKKINQNINNIDNYFRRDNILKIDEVDY